MSNITYSKQLIQLGLNIARYRKMRGLTQEELSSRIHMSRTHLSNLEAPGKVIPVDIITVTSEGYKYKLYDIGEREVVITNEKSHS